VGKEGVVDDQPRPEEAAQALTEIRQRQQQVIDLVVLPTWYWWAIAALMVVLAAGVDTHTPAAVGTAVTVFVLGIVSTTGWVVANSVRHAQLRNELLDGRGVAAILGFAALIVGITLGTAFTMRAAGSSHPATLACLAGGIGMGAGGPALMRLLRRIMLANRAGSPR
jgi:FtsH-binding integral membrane protein